MKFNWAIAVLIFMTSSANAHESDSALSQKTYPQLKIQEKEVLEAMKQNAADKAASDQERKIIEATLEKTKVKSHRRSRTLEESGRKKLRSENQPPDSIGNNIGLSCDQACRPNFDLKSEVQASCTLEDFKSIGTFQEKDTRILENPEFSPSTRKSVFLQATQGESRACVYIYYRSQGQLLAVSDACREAVTHCPTVKKEKEQLDALESRLEQIQNDLKTVADLDEDNLKELFAVRAEIKARAATDPNIPMPAYGVPEFRVESANLKRSPASDTPMEIAPPTAEPTLLKE